MSKLFREEVLDAKYGQRLGTIRLATPLSHRLLTLAALAIGGALIVFLIFGNYTRRESTTGTLVPVAGLIEVVAPSNGIVSEAVVSEGASVHADDPVIGLSSERISITFGNTAQIITEQLKLQRARIDADLSDQEKLEQEQAAGFENRISSLRAKLNQLDAQSAAKFPVVGVQIDAMWRRAASFFVMLRQFACAFRRCQSRKAGRISGGGHTFLYRP